MLYLFGLGKNVTDWDLSQHAWLGLSTKGTFSHFVPLANALDRIESEAEARLNSGEEPLDLCSSVCPLFLVI